MGALVGPNGACLVKADVGISVGGRGGFFTYH